MRNLKFLSIRKYISGTHVLIFLSAIVVFHLIAMVAYTQYSRVTFNELNRDDIIEQMINIIEVLQATSGSEREHELAKYKNPHLTYKITEKPLWQLTIREDAFWQLEKKLHGKHTALRASYQLPSGEWLNLQAHLESKAFELQIFLILMEIVVAGALLFSAWSVHRFTGPLNHFKMAAERLGVDLHSESIDVVYGPSIVRDTADAMNKMQQRIQQLISNRTKMLAAISHDLRTPITRLKLRAQFISDPEQHEKTIKDLDEMEKMISEILAYAKSEFENEEKIKLDLHSKLTAICEDMQDLGHDVKYIGCNRQVTLTGRSIALKRAFTNVVNNAIKYGKHVTIDLRVDNKNIIICVKDDGPGIPDDELTKVFDPFYRTDRARSSTTGGVGLGLSVTKEIVRAHGGKILLRNCSGGGLETVMIFNVG